MYFFSSKLLHGFRFLFQILLTIFPKAEAVKKILTEQFRIEEEKRTEREVNLHLTRMHSSRMRTARSLPYPGQRGLCPGWSPWTKTPPPGQTDACENITFPQLRLRTVSILIIRFKLFLLFLHDIRIFLGFQLILGLLVLLQFFHLYCCLPKIFLKRLISRDMNKR